MEHAFGKGEPFRVGIEDEVFLVDAELRLAHTAEDVVPRLGLPEGASGFEAFACEVELRSPPSRTAAEAVEALRRGRAARARRRRDAAGRRACTRTPSSPTPASSTRTRYRRVGDELRGLLLQRTPECALHVHVGMPDPETAIRVVQRAADPPAAARRPGRQLAVLVRARLRYGQSARAGLVRAYPGRGVPRAFRDFADFERSMEATLRAAGMEDRTQLWWDVRPHARLGHRRGARDGRADRPGRRARRSPRSCTAWRATRPSARSPVDISAEALGWSTFRAARDGLDAEILDEDGRVRPLPEVARATLSRLVMIAGELDATEALEHVERLLDEGGGAARQRAVHAREGMPGLLRIWRRAPSGNDRGGGYGPRVLAFARKEPSATLLAAQLAAVLLYPFMEGNEVGRALFSVFGIAILVAGPVRRAQHGLHLGRARPRHPGLGPAADPGDHARRQAGCRTRPRSRPSSTSTPPAR